MLLKITPRREGLRTVSTAGASGLSYTNKTNKTALSIRRWSREILLSLRLKQKIVLNEIETREAIKKNILPQRFAM